tara:strand:- start:2343 stop:2579 length:237 start_codon:yes stop_codon:yes gene_type:complete
LLKQILDRLVDIEGQLDDAYYNLPEYDANSEGKGYIDGARCDLYHLKDEIEKTILESQKENVSLDEVMNTSPTLAKLL